jgi:hypothetical protein
MRHNIGEMERFFAELDGLPEAEIKARLAVGSWDDEKRSWAQLYLDEKASKRQRAAQLKMLEVARAAKQDRQLRSLSRLFPLSSRCWPYCSRSERLRA